MIMQEESIVSSSRNVFFPYHLRIMSRCGKCKKNVFSPFSSFSLPTIMFIPTRGGGKGYWKLQTTAMQRQQPNIMQILTLNCMPTTYFFINFLTRKNVSASEYSKTQFRVKFYLINIFMIVSGTKYLIKDICLKIYKLWTIVIEIFFVFLINL